MEIESPSEAVGFSMKLRLFDERGEILSSGYRAGTCLWRKSASLIDPNHNFVHVQMFCVIEIIYSSSRQRV